MNWKRHVRDLGWDLITGAAILLIPMVESNEFTWSLPWWFAAGGIILRRSVVTGLRFAVRLREDYDETDDAAVPTKAAPDTAPSTDASTDTHSSE